MWVMGKKRTLVDKAEVNMISAHVKFQTDFKGASLDMQIIITVGFFSTDILSVCMHLYSVTIVMLCCYCVIYTAL